MQMNKIRISWINAIYGILFICLVWILWNIRFHVREYMTDSEWSSESNALPKSTNFYNPYEVLPEVHDVGDTYWDQQIGADVTSGMYGKTEQQWQSSQAQNILGQINQI